jgi:hypothetical protein
LFKAFVATGLAVGGGWAEHGQQDKTDQTVHPRGFKRLKLGLLRGKVDGMLD